LTFLKDALVVGMSQATVDYLGLVPAFPLPDTKCDLTGLTVAGGGPAATALASLARWGVGAAFIGAVGGDEFGRMILKGLEQEGVDVSAVTVAPGGSSTFAFIAVEERSAQRTIFCFRGAGVRFAPEMVDLDLVRSASVLHLDAYDLPACLAAARAAKEAGVPVVCDAGTLREGSLELMALVDHAVCSEVFFNSFHKGDDLEQGLARLKALGPRAVVVTLGKRGSLGFDGRAFHRQPAFAVTAVDTTGAGDVYHGAYIYGLLAGWDLAGRMAFASAAAALKCEHMGGRAGIPDLERLQAFLGDAWPGAVGK
jgi:sulfofructose kinase